MKNPFLCPSTAGYPPGTQTCDAESRLEMVKKMAADDLHAVLALPDVQVTVRQAAERRLRNLKKAVPQAFDQEVVEFEGALVPVLGVANCTGGPLPTDAETVKRVLAFNSQQP